MGFQLVLGSHQFWQPGPVLLSAAAEGDQPVGSRCHSQLVAPQAPLLACCGGWRVSLCSTLGSRPACAWLFPDSSDSRAHSAFPSHLPAVCRTPAWAHWGPCSFVSYVSSATQPHHTVTHPPISPLVPSLMGPDTWDFYLLGMWLSQPCTISPGTGPGLQWVPQECRGCTASWEGLQLPCWRFPAHGRSS